ncbi:MAG: hypothetical protein HY655_01850 [Acidobacteria bacterium]|nr:hypothetical protein [Acidobacteriota bacterium]
MTVADEAPVEGHGQEESRWSIRPSLSISRQLQPFGHTLRLFPAHDVRCYVRRNKTDRTDTKGMLEAN